MTVKVNSETMTLKVMNCDMFEGSILGMAHDKEIEVILVESSTPEDIEKDMAGGEKEKFERVKKPDITLNLNHLLFGSLAKKKS